MSAFPTRFSANRNQEVSSAYHPAGLHMFRHFLSVSSKHSGFIKRNEKSETYQKNL
jgi:hypothetical protein